MKRLKEYIIITLGFAVFMGIMVGIRFLPGAHDKVELTYNEAVIFSIVSVIIIILALKYSFTGKL